MLPWSWEIVWLINCVSRKHEISVPKALLKRWVWRHALVILEVKTGRSLMLTDQAAYPNLGVPNKSKRHQNPGWNNTWG